MNQTIPKKTKKTRKTYNSLRELLADQRKVKDSYRDMEENMFSYIFDPTSIGMNIASSLLDPNAKGIFSLGNIISLFKRKPKAGPAKEKAALAAVASGKSVRKEKSLVKTVAISFVKWQLFNLACWGVEKAYDRYRATRQQKKAIKSLQKEAEALEKAIK
ncbi:hypothetical protein D3C86_1121940 [compost metagenome]